MTLDDKHKSKPEFSTIRETAEDFRTSERQVRRWIKAGDLVVHRFCAFRANPATENGLIRPRKSAESGH